MKHPFPDSENSKPLQTGVRARRELYAARADLPCFNSRALPATTAQQELILESFSSTDQARLVSQLAAYSILLRYLDIRSASALRLNYPGRGNFWQAGADMFFVEPSLLLSSEPGFIRLVLAIEVTRRKLQLVEDQLDATKNLLLYSIVLPKLLAMLHATSPVFHFDTQLARKYLLDFNQQLLNCFSPVMGQPLRFASFLSALLYRWNSKPTVYSSLGPDIDLAKIDPVLEQVHPLINRFWSASFPPDRSSVYRAGAEVVHRVWPHLDCLLEQDGKICSGVEAAEFLACSGMRQSAIESRDDQLVDACARMLLLLRTGADF